MWIQSLGQEDPLEEGKATHFSTSCLENPMDRVAWQAIVQGVGLDWSDIALTYASLRIYKYVYAITTGKNSKWSLKFVTKLIQFEKLW